VTTTGVVYDMPHKDALHVFTQNKVKQEVFEGHTSCCPPTMRSSTKVAAHPAM
jgi:hypothetical protein